MLLLKHDCKLVCSHAMAGPAAVLRQGLPCSQSTDCGGQPRPLIIGQCHTPRPAAVCISAAPVRWLDNLTELYAPCSHTLRVQQPVHRAHTTALLRSSRSPGTVSRARTVAPALMSRESSLWPCTAGSHTHATPRLAVVAFPPKLCRTHWLRAAYEASRLGSCLRSMGGHGALA